MGAMRILQPRRAFVFLCSMLASSAAPIAQSGPTDHRPVTEATIPLPDFRKWVYIGGGLFSSAEGPNTRFSNVFVEPSAYDVYMKTGRWPNGTVIYGDKRAVVTTLPITQNAGWGQTGESVAAELEIKDEANGRWVYYQAARGAKVATAVADQSACTTCHTTHAAVDSIFVQFYPTLIEPARAHGTFKPTR